VTALLLDTHAWIWLAAGDRRLRKHERTLNRAAHSGELLISAMTVYEAALIGIETESGRRRGKQAVRMLPTVPQWLRDAIASSLVQPVPMEAETAMNAAALQAMHPDPFDRMILATASACGAVLVTADTKMIEFAKRSGTRLLEV
jgi:PIN domain nuclease of toxin-antitoxin system